MDQLGGLERVARGFVGHLMRGHSAQLLIDKRQELLGSPGVALRNRVQDARYLAHGPDGTSKSFEGKLQQPRCRVVFKTGQKRGL